MRGPFPSRAAWAHVLLLALAVAAGYLRTLDVPFTLDDFSSIRDNDLLYRWHGLAALWRYEPNRVVGYLSFALNYRLGHFGLAGFHVCNLLVHFAAGLAAYALARGLLRTPRLREGVPASARAGLALIAALLFVLHPLQTQAVTYVVQRLASLVALFYLASLAAYVQARLAQAGAARFGWGLACAVAAALAFFTKENSATLPIAIVLLEWMFFAPGRRRMLATAALAATALFAFWLSVALGHASSPFSANAVATLSQETPRLTRERYLATQMVVLADYLRLFVLPAGLHLDYDVPLRAGFARAGVILGVALHALLLGVAMLCRRRRPLVAFGVLFYYLAHAVESSVIPIRDLAFEHRTYLPNFGLCLAAAWLLLAELPRTRAGARAAVPVTALVLLLLGTLTWRRNEVWRDPVALWRGNAALAPAKPRPWAMLGRALLEAGRPAEGLDALEHAVSLRPAGETGVDAGMDAINMIWALRLLGRYDEALAWNARATSHAMPPALRAGFYLNEGNVYFDQGRSSRAEAAFRAALRLAPNSLPAMANLAGACAQSGSLREAESLCVTVLELDPADRVTQVNLWQVRAQVKLNQADELRREGRVAEAVSAYRGALAALETAGRLSPADPAVRSYAQRVRQLIDSLPPSAR